MPKDKDESKQTTVIFARVPLELDQFLEALVEKHRKEHPGVGYTKSAALREILYREMDKASRKK